MKKSEIFQIVLHTVSESTEISKEQITSDCRIAEVTDARCITIFWLKQVSLTANNIMKLFGFKSHASVCYHLSQYNAKLKTDNCFRYQALYIGEQIIKSGVKK